MDVEVDCELLAVVPELLEDIVIEEEALVDCEDELRELEVVADDDCDDDVVPFELFEVARYAAPPATTRMTTTITTRIALPIPLVLLQVRELCTALCDVLYNFKRFLKSSEKNLRH